MRRLNFHGRRQPAVLAGAVLLALVAGCPLTTPDEPSTDNGEPQAGQPTVADASQLDVTIEGAGAVDQEVNGSSVTLTAIPDDGWQFDTWSGSTNSQTNPLTVFVSDATQLGARFSPVEPPDTDGDGVPDESDLCAGFNDAVDEDEDGTPDDCDNCPNDPDNGVQANSCRSGHDKNVIWVTLRAIGAALYWRKDRRRGGGRRVMSRP